VLDSSRLIMNTITAAEGRADFWTCGSPKFQNSERTL
jgi:hypothetical protein